MWEMLTYSRDWTEACACFLLKETESSKSLMCDKHVVHALYVRSECMAYTYVIATVCCDLQCVLTVEGFGPSFCACQKWCV